MSLFADDRDTGVVGEVDAGSGVEAHMFAKGFRRHDGRVGVRSHVAVIYTVECARIAAERIADHSSRARVFGFGGCYDNEAATERLFQLATHPNVNAALFVSLGCECTDFDGLAARVKDAGSTTGSVVLQRDGGTEKVVEKGVQLLSAFESKMSDDRVAITPADITLGLIVQGVDEPGVELGRKLTDMWESLGGRVVTIDGQSEVRYNQGGMLSLAIENTADAVMQLAARGAQIVVLVTGEWTVEGSAVVPLVKICTDAEVYADMQEDFDLLALDGSDDDLAQIRSVIARVADGMPTAAERLGHAQHWVGYKA